MRYEKRRKGYEYRNFSTYVLLITGSVGRVTNIVIVWEWEAGREADTNGKGSREGERELRHYGKEGTVFGKEASYECLGMNLNDVDICLGNTDFYCF